MCSSLAYLELLEFSFLFLDHKEKTGGFTLSRMVELAFWFLIQNLK